MQDPFSALARFRLVQAGYRLAEAEVIVQKLREEIRAKRGSMSLEAGRLCTTSADQPTPIAGSQDQGGWQEPRWIASMEWGRITLYPEPKAQDQRTPPERITDENLTRGIFNGYMSPATRRKVRRIVSTWLRSVLIYRQHIKRKYDPGRAYPVFITVTLPSDQQHSDRQINRECWQPFLAYLKRHHGIEHYFWRAEAQANGRLHYHLLTDRYIRAEDLQHAWNKSINRLGYVDRYYERTGKADPPSTDIMRVHTHRKDRRTGRMVEVDPVDYLLDYVLDTATLDLEATKEAGSEGRPAVLIGTFMDADGVRRTYTTRPIDGRVWGMSDSLRVIREPRAIANPRLLRTLKAASDGGTLRRIDKEHVSMFFGPVHQVLRSNHVNTARLFMHYYVQIFGHLYPDQLPAEILKRRPLRSIVNLWLDLDAVNFTYREPEVIEAPTHAEILAADRTLWGWRDGGVIHAVTWSDLFSRYPQLKKAASWIENQ